MLRENFLDDQHQTQPEAEPSATAYFLNSCVRFGKNDELSQAVRLLQTYELNPERADVSLFGLKKFYSNLFVGRNKKAPIFLL